MDGRRLLDHLEGRPGIALAVALAAALLLATGTLAYLLAPPGHASVDAAIRPGADVLARARAGETHVFVLGEGTRMQLAVAYDDLKGWRIATTDGVSRAEAVVWAAVSVRGASASAVYGRVDGPPPLVVWEDGHRQVARAGPGGVYLAARGGRHACRAVDAVGPGAQTYDCG